MNFKLTLTKTMKTKSILMLIAAILPLSAFAQTPAAPAPPAPPACIRSRPICLTTSDQKFR